MVESMYPKCEKCGKGTLLPFFDSEGRNIYVCTKCCAKFGGERDYYDHVGVGELTKRFTYEPKKEEEEEEVKGKVVEISEEVDDAITVFTKIPGITKEKAVSLYNEGFKSLKDLASAAPESLLTVKNITQENVKNIKKELKGFYEKEEEN